MARILRSRNTRPSATTATSHCILAGLWLTLVTPSPVAHAETCQRTAENLARNLSAKIDTGELSTALESLNATANRRLPEKFVTKAQARRHGWRPGVDLWTVPGLDGKSIGGDRFFNREGKLPDSGRRWREADLDYRGGRRNAKRLLFAEDGTRAVTVDHYRTFITIPKCE